MAKKSVVLGKRFPSGTWYGKNGGFSVKQVRGKSIAYGFHKYKKK